MLAFAVIIALEHVLLPRLGPTDHMISEYVTAGGLASVLAVGALAAWSVSFLAAALLSACPASRGRATRILTVCLGLACVGLAVTAVFPTQAVGGVVPSGVERTLAGQLHDLGGSLAQITIFAAALLSVWAAPWSSRLRAAAVILVAVALILGPALTVLDVDARGLRQRGLVAMACAWEMGLVITLAQGAGETPRRSAHKRRSVRGSHAARKAS